MKTKKATYRISNWKEYNRALKQRGSLTIWLSDEAIKNWTTDQLIGERGASPTYTDLAIETMAIIQVVYSLPGRPNAWIPAIDLCIDESGVNSS